MLWIICILFLGILIYSFYPEPKLPEGISVDYIAIYKSKQQLKAYSQGKLLKTYTISLGKNPIGHKEVEGDNKTPEGVYYINTRNANSTYHKNLSVSYPNEKDIAHAQLLGQSAGGDIKIHGIRNGIGFIHKFHRWANWTAGCIALTNDEIEELYHAVLLDSKIEIFP